MSHATISLRLPSSDRVGVASIYQTRTHRPVALPSFVLFSVTGFQARRTNLLTIAQRGRLADNVLHVVESLESFFAECIRVYAAEGTGA